MVDVNRQVGEGGWLHASCNVEMVNVKQAGRDGWMGSCIMQCRRCYNRQGGAGG